MGEPGIVDYGFSTVINAPTERIAHNRQETPLFAASIERAALRNQEGVAASIGDNRRPTVSPGRAG